MNNLKNIISSNRKKQNLTQRELGNLINVSDKQISKWETGVSYPDITIINDLAKALNISVNELLNSDDLNTTKYSENINYNLINKIKITSITSNFILLTSIILFIISGLIGNAYEVFAIILSILSTLSFLGSIIFLIISNINNRQEISMNVENEKYQILYYYKNLIYLLMLTILLVICVLGTKSWNSYIVLKDLNFNMIFYNICLLILFIIYEIIQIMKKRLNVISKIPILEKIFKYSTYVIIFIYIINTIILNIYLKHVYLNEYLYRYFRILNFIVKYSLILIFIGKTTLFFINEKKD